MPTVTRVLPWRRHSAPRASELRPLVLAMNEARDRPDIALVERAYDLSLIHISEPTRPY